MASMVKTLLARLVSPFGDVTSGADWDPTKYAYFLLDNDAGNDANVGYVVDVAGADLTGYAATHAIKTSERLRQIFPKQGNARRAIILIKPRAGGANYLKMDGVTQDDLDLRGVSGYSDLLVRASDLTNTTSDKNQTGFITGYGTTFTVGSGSTVSNIVVVESLPTENTVGRSTITGMRIRFTSGALSGRVAYISANGANNIEPGIDTESAAVAGTTFVIERPGVRFAHFIDTARTEHRPLLPSTIVGTSDRTIGIAVTAIDVQAFVCGGRGSASTYTGCEVVNAPDGTTFITPLQANGGAQNITFTNTWTDEIGVGYTVGIGVRCAGGVTIAVARNLLILSSAFLANDIKSNLTARAMTIGNNGGYWGVVPRMQGSALPAYTMTNASNGISTFGRGVNNATRRRQRLFGFTLGLNDCVMEVMQSMAVRGNSFEQAGSLPLIEPKGTGLFVNFDDNVGSAGNTGYVIDARYCAGCTFTFGGVTANTWSATLGGWIGNLNNQVLTVGAIAFATCDGCDKRHNKYIGPAGNAAVPTASLPAAGTGLPDGSEVIEDTGGGARNLILYDNGARYRFTGSASF